MTKGTCSNCQKTMSKGAMTRHLGTCGHSEQGNPTWLVSVCARQAPADYWAHLEVPRDATLQALDGYLRDLWLECCGHLSQFEIDGRTYALDTGLLGGGPNPFGDFDDASMDIGIGEVLRPGREARHVYDMGSTTDLLVRCLDERAGAGGGDIRLLARNAPPRIDCVACGSPATTICVECDWDGSGCLCDRCATTHVCDDDLYLPISNSPRSGVCGYVGGVAMR